MTSSSAFTVVAMTMSVILRARRNLSISSSMEGFPRISIIVLPGRREEPIRASIMAFTLFMLYIPSVAAYFSS